MWRLGSALPAGLRRLLRPHPPLLAGNITTGDESPYHLELPQRDAGDAPHVIGQVAIRGRSWLLRGGSRPAGRLWGILALRVKCTPTRGRRHLHEKIRVGAFGGGVEPPCVLKKS